MQPRMDGALTLTVHAHQHIRLLNVHTTLMHASTALAPA